MKEISAVGFSLPLAIHASHFVHLHFFHNSFYNTKTSNHHLIIAWLACVFIQRNSIMKKKLTTIFFFTSLCVSLFGQQTITGNVFDNETKEPLIGATILLRSNQMGTVTNVNGQFSISCQCSFDTLEVSYVGYEKQVVIKPASQLSISLAPSASNLQQIIVTANREAALRTEAPVAISKLSPVIIN